MRCPICKNLVADEGPACPPTFPFCSERCKVIDLGRWLDGKYQIPVVEHDPDENDPPPAFPRDDSDDR
jgi:endogenous inhibitor of DNA gyrase (YacG/DUF329 family)